jgi:PAS domain S-box-containing protein
MSLKNQADNFPDYLNSKDNYEHLFKFFEYSPDLLCIASFDGYFIKINPSVSKILGYTEEELYNTHIMKFVHPQDREGTIAHRNGIIKGESLLNYENRYLKKDGSFIWLSWTSVPYNDLKCVFAIAKDITNQKLLEKEKNDLLDDLLIVNKRLAHFAKVASHDLRSPILNIISLFDFIEEDNIKDEETLAVFRLIKKSTHRVQETLQKYIDDISNVETQKETQLQNIEIITADVIGSISESLKLSNTKIKTDFDSFNEILFKKNYLESIIQNLITNTVKYASPLRDLEINICSQIKNNVKQFVISDNGLGMDMDLIQNKIFKMNQTFHSNKDGKGVGLFLVKSQLEEMGAQIEVYSEVNVGTRFTITFATDQLAQA